MSEDYVDLFDNLYRQAYYAWDAYFPEAERDLRFYLGDQWDEQEKRNLYEQGRSTFVFNRIRRVVNLVGGYQRKHRLSSVVLPVEDDDQNVADQLTRILLHVFGKGDFYEYISDAFAGALKTGWNLLSLWKDYRDDPVNGDIKVCREPYNAFILDPYFYDPQLSDCSYIMRRKYLSREQAMSLLPKHSEQIDELHSWGWQRDDKFTWLPYQRQPNGQDMLAYNELYQQKWEKVPVITDPETGDYIDWVGTDRELSQFLKSFPNLVKTVREKRYIEMHVIVNDHYITSEKNPYGLDEYPFVPFWCLFEPESDQWDLKVQSLVRVSKDAQKECNRRRSQMVDLIESQINSGWIADEHSVKNPESLYKSGQGQVIWRKVDSRPGALEKIPPGQIPGSMFQLQELFDKDVSELSGVNEASFGEPQNAQESGVMMMLRQGASIVNMQDVFDRLRLSQKSLSRKVLKMTQSWTESKFKRILNEAPDPKIRLPDLTRYDLSIQEGMLTDTQKQMYFRQLVDLKGLGAPVSGEQLALAAPIQGKKALIESIQQAEEAQGQQAQAQAQAAQKLQEMQAMLVEAQAARDNALAMERQMRVVFESRKDMAEANKDQADVVATYAKANLDRVKAMKELQDVRETDLNRLERTVSLVNREQKEEASDEEAGLLRQGPRVPGDEGLLQVP